jgi:hypothetical protein
MKGMIFAVLIVVVSTSCGGKKEPEIVELNHVGLISDIIPMADGSAYVSTYIKDGKEWQLWFVSGTRRTRVNINVEAPNITAMADGTALLNTGDKLWRLNKSKVKLVTDQGIESNENSTKTGFLFTQWQKERGLTEADRATYEEELTSEQVDDGPE